MVNQSWSKWNQLKHQLIGMYEILKQAREVTKLIG
jgi:hypothetical protein